MSRKPREEIPEDAKNMDLVAAEKQEKELTAQKALEMYGDGLPYERLRYVEEVKSLLELTQKSIIETGKRLLILKANEEHGGFIHTLEQIGIPYRTAARFMQIARRFGKYANLAYLNTSKLEALEDLTEKEIEDLDEGKDVLGLDLDDIDRMTAKQLREELRKGRKQVEKLKDKHTKEIAEMNDEISVLRMKASGQDFPTPEQIAGGRLEELNGELFGALMSGIADIRKALGAISKAEQVEDVTYPLLRAWANKYTESFEGLTAAYEDLIDAFKQPYIDDGEGEEE